MAIPAFAPRSERLNDELSDEQPDALAKELAELSRGLEQLSRSVSG